MIVWGGWDGHQPKEVADLFQADLADNGFDVCVRDTLSAFTDMGENLKDLDLIVPVWTMGEISWEQVKAVTAAVENGVGIGGCHGGMCDSFRNSTEWQFMTGGQWVAHPGNDGVEYTVRITERTHPVTAGIEDFQVRSEQYYMHTDPSNKVLATTTFPVADGPHVPNGPFDMPVVWTRLHGKGRVFYCSLGHQANILEEGPVRQIMLRGLCWASKS